MRTFIAIELPAEIQTAIAALQDDLRRARAEVSWTKPGNIHLTLKFLGEIEEGMAGAAAQACVEVTQGCAPFALSLGGTGAFPNAKQPRVLWVGFQDGVSEARRLQAQLDERLAAAGFAKEERPVHPHLTMGRVKSRRGAAELLKRAEAYQLPELSFVAREIVLMRSELHPAGARYTPLATAQFQAG
jgi:2'-5' RNA ligase